MLVLAIAGERRYAALCATNVLQLIMQNALNNRTRKDALNKGDNGKFVR